MDFYPDQLETLKLKISFSEEIIVIETCFKNGFMRRIYPIKATIPINISII